jgi:hypothetical protein
VKGSVSLREDDLYLEGLGTAGDGTTSLTDHLIPSRWHGSHFLHTSQAVNCQAIRESLRDKVRTGPSETTQS